MSKFGWSYPPGAASDPYAPYNQEDPPILEDGIPEHDATCPACGEVAAWFRETTEPGPFNDLTSTELDSEGWHCESCDWSQETVPEDYEDKAELDGKYKDRVNAVKLAISAFDQKRSNAMRDYQCHTSPDEIFGFHANADFTSEGEAGDWHCYHCGERDCPVGWHLIAYQESYACVDGVRQIEFNTVDSDGNWDCSFVWQDGDDWREADQWFAFMSDDYFRCWAEYCIDCFYSGRDPLNQALRVPDDWREFCLKGAEDMVRYLKNV